MRQDKLSRQNIILYLCGMLPVVWIALLIAPHLHGGPAGDHSELRQHYE